MIWLIAHHCKHNLLQRWLHSVLIEGFKAPTFVDLPNVMWHRWWRGILKLCIYPPKGSWSPESLILLVACASKFSLRYQYLSGGFVMLDHNHTAEKTFYKKSLWCLHLEKKVPSLRCLPACWPTRCNGDVVPKGSRAGAPRLSLVYRCYWSRPLAATLMRRTHRSHEKSAGVLRR